MLYFIVAGVFASAVGLFLWIWMRRSFAQTPPTIEPHEITFQITGSVHTYDSDAYRFDGLAGPEYRIGYLTEAGGVTEREIWVDDWWRHDGITYYRCWCFLRDEKRTFRSDRITSIVNLDTGRRLKDIAAHRTR